MQPNNNRRQKSENSSPQQKRAPRSGSRNSNKGGSRQSGNKPAQINTNLTTSRGQAVRAQRRSQADAQRIANQYQSAESRPARANVVDDSPRLKIIGLGGMDGGGSKNMILVEYVNDAVILDCGNDLGVDLPGINYGIADTSYLEQIQHKIRAYVITHGQTSVYLCPMVLN
jgi:ribonuclease J